MNAPGMNAAGMNAAGMNDAGMHDVLTLEPAVPFERGAATEQLLVCKQVQRVTHDMKTFVFEPCEPGLFRHEPGQFLTFTFTVGGREIQRCYTLSSPPTRPHLATITVKRVPGGEVSNWLHDHLAPGDVVRARGPHGHFTSTRHPAPAYLFLSGGSGVTPLMSMTRTFYDLASPADVVFVHSARTPEDIPFRQELDLMAGAMPRLRVAHVCEEDGSASPWPGPRGRLTLDQLRDLAPDFLAREVFTCGPPGYMRAVREMLSGAGFPMDRYHQESFDLADLDGPPEGVREADGAQPGASSEPDARATFAVSLSRSGTSIECDAGTPVLEAAARAGVTLPSSCGQGLCGSCVTTLEQGTVDMRHNGGISPRDTAQNKILLCCSTPLENLVIDA